MNVRIKWNNRRNAEALRSAPLKAALKRALRKAGSTALRDMRSEASKRIRARKRIPISYIHKALTMRKEDRGEVAGMKWKLQIAGDAVPLSAYPHRQTKKGVSVEVNRGKRTVVKRSFLATMRSGHEGVFQRLGSARLPIRELLGSRPLDALSHDGETEAVAARGAKSFVATFDRLLPLEIDKAGK